MPTEILTGWRAYDEARRDLDEAEEARDKEGLAVPGYDSPVERPERINRRRYEPAEYAARLEQLKISAITHRLNHALRWNIQRPPVQHIWADELLNEVELRSGNPPADIDRPRHLRGLDLVVDPARPTGGKLPNSLFAAYHELKRAQRAGGGAAFGAAVERARSQLHSALGLRDDDKISV